MSTTDDSFHEPPRGQREVARLIRQIQALTAEIRQLERRGRRGAQLAARERAREQLRWRLAVAARRAANGDVVAAS